MANLLVSLLPIFGYFVAGFVLHSFDTVSKETGALMLKVVFYVNMPAVILLSITTLSLTMSLLFLPLSAVLVHLVIALTSYIVVNLLEDIPERIGVMIVGSLIMSTSFVVPFVLVFQDELGLGLLLFFDLGNTIMSLSVAYFFAVYYGSDQSVELLKVIREFIKKFISAPPALALVVALLINTSDTAIPEIVLPVLDVLKFLFTPLIMIALGVFFVPRIPQLRQVLTSIVIRSGIGLLIGFLCVFLFGLTGVERLIVLVGSSAPVGFVTVAFASLEDLDVELAANMASLSAVIGLGLVPILFVLV